VVLHTGKLRSRSLLRLRFVSIYKDER